MTIVKLLKQNQALKAGSCKQSFKAQLSDLYYKNLHLDCYCFCLQCKDYFKTTRASRPNRNFFATLFFYKLVIQQWHQHKHYSKVKNLLIWLDFKNFFQKNLKDNWVKKLKSSAKVWLEKKKTTTKMISNNGNKKFLLRLFELMRLRQVSLKKKTIIKIKTKII